MSEMSSTCSPCDNDATASLLQEPLCDEHAQERLAELEEEKEELESKFQDAKERYNNLLDKYDVNSYGHIEHQLNVEDREDIDEEDVQKVNEAESEFAAVREEFEGIKKKISDLNSSL